MIDSKKSAEGWRALAWAHYQAGRYRDMESAANEMVQAMPENPDALYTRGVARMSRMMVAAAKDDFDLAMILVDTSELRAKLDRALGLCEVFLDQLSKPTHAVIETRAAA